MNGVAGAEEFNLITHGAVVNEKGQVVPEQKDGVHDKVSGDTNGLARRKRERDEAGTPPVRDRHDIR